MLSANADTVARPSCHLGDLTDLAPAPDRPALLAFVADFLGDVAGLLFLIADTFGALAHAAATAEDTLR